MEKEKWVEYQQNLDVATQKVFGFMSKVLKNEGWSFVDAPLKKAFPGCVHVKKWVRKGEEIYTMWDSKNSKEVWVGVQTSFRLSHGSIKELLQCDHQEFRVANGLLEKYAHKYLNEELKEIRSQLGPEAETFLAPANIESQKEEPSQVQRSEAEQQHYERYQKVDYAAYERSFLKKNINLRKVLVTDYGFVVEPERGTGTKALSLHEQKLLIKQVGNIMDLLEGVTKVRWNEDGGAMMAQLAPPSAKSGAEEPVVAKGAYVARSPFDLANKESLICITWNGKYFVDSTGKQGDIIDFQMENTGTDYKTAIQQLMERYKPSPAKVVGEVPEQPVGERQPVYRHPTTGIRIVVKPDEKYGYQFLDLTQERWEKTKKEIMVELKKEGAVTDIEKEVTRRVTRVLSGSLPELIALLEPQLSQGQVQAKVIDIALGQLTSDQLRDYLSRADGRQGTHEALSSTQTLAGRITQQGKLVQPAEQHPATSSSRVPSLVGLAEQFHVEKNQRETFYSQAAQPGSTQSRGL